jgi:hypothetical protein
MDLSDQRHGGYLHTQEGEFSNIKSLKSQNLTDNRPEPRVASLIERSPTSLMNYGAQRMGGRRMIAEIAPKNIDLSLPLSSVRTGSSV